MFRRFSINVLCRNNALLHSEHVSSLQLTQLLFKDAVYSRPEIHGGEAVVTSIAAKDSPYTVILHNNPLKRLHVPLPVIF